MIKAPRDEIIKKRKYCLWWKRPGLLIYFWWLFDIFLYSVVHDALLRLNKYAIYIDYEHLYFLELFRYFMFEDNKDIVFFRKMQVFRIYIKLSQSFKIHVYKFRSYVISWTLSTYTFVACDHILPQLRLSSKTKSIH